MKYELVVIFKTEIDQKTAQAKLDAALGKLSLKISGIEWIANKLLSYPIKKQLSANYLFSEISGENTNPNLLYTDFKLDASILRALVLKKEEKE